jgi:hypothetical protein
MIKAACNACLYDKIGFAGSEMPAQLVGSVHHTDTANERAYLAIPVLATGQMIYKWLYFKGSGSDDQNFHAAKVGLLVQRSTMIELS